MAKIKYLILCLFSILCLSSCCSLEYSIYHPYHSKDVVIIREQPHYYTPIRQHYHRPVIIKPRHHKRKIIYKPSYRR